MWGKAAAECRRQCNPSQDKSSFTPSFNGGGGPWKLDKQCPKADSPRAESRHFSWQEPELFHETRGAWGNRGPGEASPGPSPEILFRFPQLLLETLQRTCVSPSPPTAAPAHLQGLCQVVNKSQSPWVAGSNRQLSFPFNSAALVPMLQYTKMSTKVDIMELGRKLKSRRAILVAGTLIGLHSLRLFNSWLSRRASNNGITDKTWNWNQEIVLLTGGSGGIGSVIAKRLAERRVKVIIVDVEPPTGKLGMISGVSG